MRKKTLPFSPAFTMIELVFVIVVLGILAAIAVPKLAATRTDAEISKGAADVAAIRSGIVSVRQRHLLKGDYTYPAALSGGGAASGLLFDGDGTGQILMYPITAKDANGHWRQNGENYIYKVKNLDCTFEYDDADGTFDLTGQNDAICDFLVQ